MRMSQEMQRKQNGCSEEEGHENIRMQEVPDAGVSHGRYDISQKPLADAEVVLGNLSYGDIKERYVCALP